MTTILSTLRMRHIACMAAAACAVALGANYLQSEPVQSRTVVGPALAAEPAFGPGGRVDVGKLESLNASGEGVPAVIAAASFTTEEGELVVNAGLLQVFDFFMLGVPDDNRGHASIALHTFLASKLTAASAQKAMQIAADYQSYMTRHDDLLAAQNFDRRAFALSTLDVARIRTWMQLRQRLRESVLGEAVADAWYQNDDAQLNHVLDELQQAGNIGALDDANRQYMQRILDQAAMRFADLARRPF